ncbi:MAG: hypothetical protein JXA57_08845 [Armatimonadetes bacterium]|nr:hypothetical protein [Armatimonadota bacterium]
MSETLVPEWLPGFVEFGDYGRNWDNYCDALYQFFRQDFVDDTPMLMGTKVGLKRYPLTDGREATFWHLISEGQDEATRTPDFQRCRRIRWPRPIIEHADHMAVKVWENRRGTETRICLWFEAAEYVVVLALRKRYLLLWTAYLVTEPHRKRKFQKEYEEARRQANAAPR